MSASSGRAAEYQGVGFFDFRSRVIPRICGKTLNVRALKNFHPSDPNWIMLKSLYDKTAPSTDKAAQTTRCAFCGLKCGRTVRECASNRQGGDVAGRKALKDRIRACENEGDTQNVLEHLFDVYLKVS